jgi:hypothetical protein
MEATAIPLRRPNSTATPLRLPLSFLLSGAVASVLLGVGAIFVLPTALTDPQAMQVLALVHTATLGWFTMTIMGAMYQLVPVVLVTRLRAVALAYAQMALYLAGVVLLVSGFWFNVLPLLAVGGSLVVAAASVFALHLLATILLASRRPLTAAYLIASLLYLLLVVSLGLTAAFNLRWGFLGAATSHLFLAHLVIGLGGWLGLTVIGVTYKLTPMFALVHRKSERFGWGLLVLLNAGLIGLALSLGLAAPAWLVDVFGGALGLGLLGFVFDFGRMLRARQKRALDVMQRFTVAGAGYLALGVVLGSAIVAFHLDAAFGPVWLAAAYLLLVGWIGQTILGNLQKIVPFLVWNQRYARRVGRTKTPLLRDLIHLPTARLAFWLLNAGILAEAAALAFASPLAVSLAAIPVALALVLCAANLAGVLYR